MSSKTNNHIEEKESLLKQIDSLIKQCRNRFVNKYELATESDSLILYLCSSLEDIFNHGLRKYQKTSNRNRLLSGILQKSELYFWNFITLFLTEHEVRRFSSLRNVHTDLGRGKSWIRNLLNEHSLEKYFLMIIEDKSERRQQFYHDWALLLDSDKNTQLPSLSQSLNSILFALNIDTADLDASTISNYQSRTHFEDDSPKLLIPIRQNENNVKLVKSEKKKNNLIIIDNEVPIDTSFYARSAPVTSFLSPSMSTQDSIDDINLSYEKRSSSSFSMNQESSSLYLYPISNELNVSLNQHSISPISNELLINEKIETLQKEKAKLVRENNLLNIQLKKYLATIELLKYNKCTMKQKEEKEEIDQQEIENYQKKLIQVSEMHGEIVEFNEHLYKVIRIKDSIITRLRNKLIELRAPLPDQDEVMSISTELESNSLQSLTQPLIHIWIPTAFLSGGFKGKSHHIYQIYVRIKEEEWNVYRRYSQFHSLHKLLKTQYPLTSRFEFPPKKAIGNKDSHVVQERRKKLESYLRNVINHIQLQNSDINNKEKFTYILPFLSDKYFLQDRSQSESSDTQQQSQSRNYMGF